MECLDLMDCMPSDDGFWSESNTDIGHKCGMYVWFVDIYIGKFDRYWNLQFDPVPIEESWKQCNKVQCLYSV